MLNSVENIENSLLRIVEHMRRYGGVYYSHDALQLCTHFTVRLEFGSEYKFDVSMYDLLNHTSTTLLIQYHSDVLNGMKEGKHGSRASKSILVE